MNSILEMVEFQDMLPVRAFFNSVETFGMHWHPELEILLVFKGSVFVTVQNATYTIREGELIVIGGSQLHATQQTAEPNQLLTLQVNCAPFAFFDADIASTCYECHGGAADSPHLEHPRANICEIFLAMLHQQPGYRYQVAAQVQQMLWTLHAYFPHHTVRTMESIRQRDRERMQRIMAYIRDNHTRRISLADISAQEFISVNYLSTFFKQAIGMSFSDYLNSVRLRSMQEMLQSDPDTTVDEICAQCGFSSPQFARRLFREAFGTTPGHYRDYLAKKARAQASQRESSYSTVFQAADFADILERWRNAPCMSPETSATPTPTVLPIDCTAQTGAYHRSCLKITTIGRAYEGLLAFVQTQLRQLQADIGFTHLRCHGIFSDEMMILKPDAAGDVQYSWRMVDMLFDFLLSVGLRPFIELTFMPSLLASGQTTVFAWQGNITPPADPNAWTQLVEAFASHCVARYGAPEVAQWYFEVWNEPDYTDVSWTGTEQQFFRFYAETARALRRAYPAARICGPSITRVGITSRRWVGPFCDYVREQDLPLDVITCHAYPEILDGDNLRESLRNVGNRLFSFTPDCDLMGPAYAEETIASMRGQLGSLDTLPIAVTEWNLSLAMYNPINDSAFAGTSLLTSALACDDASVMLAHWTATDYMEQQTLPPQEFHGGFGLLTCSGVHKPTYWAM